MLVFFRVQHRMIKVNPFYYFISRNRKKSKYDTINQKVTPAATSNVITVVDHNSLDFLKNWRELTSVQISGQLSLFGRHLQKSNKAKKQPLLVWFFWSF